MTAKADAIRALIGRIEAGERESLLPLGEPFAWHEQGAATGALFGSVDSVKFLEEPMRAKGWRIRVADRGDHIEARLSEPNDRGWVRESVNTVATEEAVTRLLLVLRWRLHEEETP